MTRRRPLTHVDPAGKARMVDVGEKPVTRREAVAKGRVRLSAQAFARVKENRLAKGDVLTVAQLAGIEAAKRTFELIPVCHPLPLDGIEVKLTLDEKELSVQIEARARCRAATGVEMEALTAVAVAGLAVYDMVKAVDRAAVVSDIRLVSKTGGRSR